MNQQNAKRQTASAAKNGPCEAAGAPLRPITQGMDKSPPLHQPTKSYKDKRRMEHPRDECMVIEGSHEPIIDRETWDIVQRVRQHKRRRTNMDEQNMVIAMYANSRRVPKVVTKINRGEYCALLPANEAECVVTPLQLTSTNILRYVRAMQNRQGEGVLTLHRLVDERVEALEFRVTQSTRYLGVALKDMPLKPNLLVALISRRDKVLVPSGSDYFAVDDTVVIVTKSDRSFNALNDIFGGGQK